MEISKIITHIEALIFASDKPLTTLELVELVNNALGFIEERATLEQVEASIDGIREKYATEFYPFELRQSGGGWQFLTKADYHKTIAQLNGDKFLKRLSAAAMETLAIIAYKQPITKGEMESIRGVNCDYVVQKLLEKDLVVISGRSEDLPGKPLIYNTSKSFMDYFGLNSTDDLPKVNEILANQIVEPTLVNAEHFDVEAESKLVVREDGELVDNVGINESEISSADYIEANGEQDVQETSDSEDVVSEHEDSFADEINDEYENEADIGDDDEVSDDDEADEKTEND